MSSILKPEKKQRYCIINEKRRHKYEQVFESYLPVPSPPPETSVLQMTMNKGRLPISSFRPFKMAHFQQFGLVEISV